ILRLGINRKRKYIGSIQNSQLARNDFDLAGRKVWVFRARRARSDSTRHLDNVFVAQTMSFLCQFRVFFRSKNNLRQSFAVAQIDEGHAAMITRDVYPASKRDLPADVCLAK